MYIFSTFVLVSIESSGPAPVVSPITSGDDTSSVIAISELFL